jgi:hypothetical protein
MTSWKGLFVIGREYNTPILPATYPLKSFQFEKDNISQTERIVFNMNNTAMQTLG